MDTLFLVRQGTVQAHIAVSVTFCCKFLELYVHSCHAGEGSGHKLELIKQFKLYGVVESMAVLKSRAKKGQRDALLLAFRLVTSACTLFIDAWSTCRLGCS